MSSATPSSPWPIPTTLSRRAEILCVALLLPLVFRVALAPLFASDYTFAAHDDNVHQLGPIFSEMSRAFQQWQFPYWMPSVLAGLPLYNDPDLSAAYPFYFLIFDVFRTPLEAMRSIHVVTLFHLFVLQVNSYVLMRTLRARPVAAGIGASLIAFSPNSLNYAEWVNIAASYSWLPLVIASVILILERRKDARPVLFGTVGFALLVLASPAQGIIHAIYIIAVLLAGRTVYWIARRDLHSMRGALADLSLMAVGTVAASSPALLPPLFNLDDMIRFAGNRPPSVGAARVPFEATLEGQLAPSDWPSVLIPFHVPMIVGSWFVGLSAGFFAFVGAVNLRRSWVITPLILLASWALGSAMGSHLGFAQFNFHLPFLDMFREPPRHMVVFVISAASLAAIGFDFVTARYASLRQALSVPSLLVVGLFGVVAALAVRAPLQYSGIGSPRLAIALFVAVLCVTALSLGRRGISRAALVTIAAALIVGGTWIKPISNSSRFQASKYFVPGNLASHRVLRDLANVVDRQYRITFEGSEERASNWAMNGSYYGLRSFMAFKNPIASARQFDEVFYRPRPAGYYPILGGKYHLCTRCDTVDPAVYRLDRTIGGQQLWVSDRAVGRYAVITRVAGLYKTAEEFFARISPELDFSHEAILASTVSFSTLPELMSGDPAKSHVEISEESRTFNSVELGIGTDHDAIVMLNEYYSDAWKATVNGRAVRLLRVNLNQIGVPVEVGGSLVRFEYRPTMTVWLLRLEILLGSILVGWLARRGWLAARNARSTF